MSHKFIDSYCNSRFISERRISREINVGNCRLGGKNPIRIQSMTTTNTQDIKSTVKQCLHLADAGCEIVRITAPNKKSAESLKYISKELREAKCNVPLVADIHFLPSVAMEASKYVEKIRINPGNYADKKKFIKKHYTDLDYKIELDRIYEAFSPIVVRCKELGRAMRIGTNHGSLSDRIMNRYGDTPLGMVESALEFIRIAESHSYYDICLSLKASNPKIMIQANRLAVSKMNSFNMKYPIHIGVTEAGDGEDARIKSSIGIGSLLADGIGDTIRVSLTEDPIHEVPIAQNLARKSKSFWSLSNIDVPKVRLNEGIDYYSYERAKTNPTKINKDIKIGGENFPRTIIKSQEKLNNYNKIIKDICKIELNRKDNKIEGLLFEIANKKDLKSFQKIQQGLDGVIPFFVLDLSEKIDLDHLIQTKLSTTKSNLILTQKFTKNDNFYLLEFLKYCTKENFIFAPEIDIVNLNDEISLILSKIKTKNFILSSNTKYKNFNAINIYRKINCLSKKYSINCPIWIRNTKENSVDFTSSYSDTLIENSILSGSLLCDGIGDIVSVENLSDLEQSLVLCYNILQGSRSRITKTEFVACPSCGRTLFDLEKVTKKIRSKTDHLKGVTIAIMGCIVNGPGEMADADFGYVGGAPKKINLYVGKKCVEYNVPESKSLDKLIELIKKKANGLTPKITAIITCRINTFNKLYY